MTGCETRERVVHRFFRAVDTRDWDQVLAAMTEHPRLDYTSLFGGEPEDLASSEVIERWRGLLPGFDATMHLLGPLVHEGDTVECNVRGYHHLGNDTWMVAGWYTLLLVDGDEGPVIAGIRLLVSYETGSRDLVDRAQERASG